MYDFRKFIRQKSQGELETLLEELSMHGEKQLVKLIYEEIQRREYDIHSFIDAQKNKDYLQRGEEKVVC